MESLTEFVFNPNDGRFKCTQPAHECDAVFGGHRLKLARELSGRIEDNHIHDLKVCPGHALRLPQPCVMP